MLEAKESPKAEQHPPKDGFMECPEYARKRLKADFLSLYFTLINHFTYQLAD